MNDGGPAFPLSSEPNVAWGMSLRDYFAAHAPIEPADWFRCEPLPGRPERPSGDGLSERVVKVACDGERKPQPPLTDTEAAQVKAFRAQREAFFAAEKAWFAADLQFTYVSWRWAYADAMLAARSK